MLRHPQAVRSSHPATSVVAIGKAAHAICDKHDAGAPSYGFIRDLMDLDGRMLVIGCVHSSPGFITDHYAQYMLGLAGRSLMKNRWQVYYRKDGQVRLFKRPDPGGHGGGFAKFYRHYVQAGVLLAGRVGNAYSIAVKARDAYEIVYAGLKENPRYGLCGDPRCLECNCTWTYNLRGIPRYLLTRALMALRLARR